MGDEDLHSQANNAATMKDKGSEEGGSNMNDRETAQQVEDQRREENTAKRQHIKANAAVSCSVCVRALVKHSSVRY